MSSQNKCQDWLDDAKTYGGPLVRPPCSALHAVLKVRSDELEAIRAFVERVEKRLPDYDTGRAADAMLKAYRQAVYDELEAMEEASTPSGQSSSVPSTD